MNNDQIRTSITNSKRDGWHAETVIPMGAVPPADASVAYRGTGQRLLSITTSKQNIGVVTRASCNVLYPDGCESFVLFGDFSKRLIVANAKGTQGKITGQHNLALEQQLASIIAMAEAFYAPKVAPAQQEEEAVAA